jgi:hypothetical protein
MEKLMANVALAPESSGMSGRKGNRTISTIGVLNIVFSVPYAIVGAAAMLLGVVLLNQARQVVQIEVLLAELVASVCVHGITSLGLLVAGIQLLQGRAGGRSLTRVTALVVVIFVALDACFAAAVLERSGKGLPGAVLTGLAIRAAYPIIATLVLSPSPEHLGLKRRSSRRRRCGAEVYDLGEDSICRRSATIQPRWDNGDCRRGLAAHDLGDDYICRRCATIQDEWDGCKCRRCGAESQAWRSMTHAAKPADSLD